MAKRATEGRATDGSSTEGRPTDLRLARLHLRTGALGLARAEFEAFAGEGSLDDEALLDLAEVRWRTGDLTGAGAVAQTCLARGREDVVALVIAAEATAALGRPGEARRLAGRALELAAASLDSVFAGMPRSAIWPHDPADPGEPAGSFFPSASEIGTANYPSAAGAASARAAEPSLTPDPAPGLWDGGEHGVHAAAEIPDGRAELETAEVALAAGDEHSAALHLAVVLRATPALAPAVLDAIAGRTGPEMELVRGDAYRLVGHETDARLAFSAAADQLRGPTRPEPSPEPLAKEEA